MAGYASQRPGKFDSGYIFDADEKKDRRYRDKKRSIQRRRNRRIKQKMWENN